MTSYETYCVVKYGTWPTPSTVQITNEGTGGSYYVGTAYQNDYTTTGYGGATAWAFANNSAELITIPSGSAIDDIANLTLEFLIYFKGNNSSSTDNVLLTKNSSAAAGLEVAIDHVNLNVLVGKVATGPAWDQWKTPASGLSANHWYFIQVTWAMGSAPGTSPIVYINGALQSMTHTITGSGTWLSDAGQQIVLGNFGSLSYQLYATLALFRMHNVVLTPPQLYNNYQQELWRITNPVIQTAVPNAAAATTASAFTAASVYTEAPTKPNVAAAFLALSLIASAHTQTNVPNVAAAPRTPTLAGVSHYTESTTPNVAAAVLAPVVIVAEATAAYEDDCIIKYVEWPMAGTTIYNMGIAAPTYNGTDVTNRYGRTGWGAATYQDFNGSSDYVSIPMGTAINDQLKETWEIIIYPSSIDNRFLVSKQATSGQFAIQLFTGNLYLYSPCTGNNYDEYATTNACVSLNQWSFVQVSWDRTGGVGTNAPVVYVNGVAQPLTHINTGSGSWNSNASNGMYLGTGNPALYFYGRVALYRYHNTNLTPTQLRQNYLAEVWRYTTASVETTVPNVAASTPVISTSTASTLTTVPNVAAAAVAPTVAVHEFTAAYENDCVVKYSYWPPAGLTIQNRAATAPAFDGAVYENEYGTTGYGSATYFSWPDANQKVTVPLDASLDNLYQLSLEGIVYIGTLGDYKPICTKKQSTGYMGFDEGAGGTIRVFAGVNSSWDIWTTTSQQLYAGNWYHIIVTWDKGTATGNAPTVYVNGSPAAVTHTLATSGTWYSDSGYPWMVGYSQYGGTSFNASGNKIALFRLHTAVLTADQVYQNWLAGLWRYTDAVAETTIPGAAAAVLAPTVSSGGATQIAPDVASYVILSPTPAYETSCAIKFADWPTTGTTITNEASTGAAYNGTAYQNDYTTTGYATAWHFPNNTSDKITIPDGAAVQNMANVTFEFIYYYAGAGGAANLLFAKPDSQVFQVWIGSGQIAIARACFSASYWDSWGTNATLTSGNWYFIQITWALGSTPGATPTIYVNNISQSLWHTPPFYPWPWVNDAGEITIGNIHGNNYQLNGTLALLRIHNVVLSSGQLTQNYLADYWRYNLIQTVTPASTLTQTTIPNATAATQAISTSSNIHLPSPSNATTTIQVPTYARSSNIILTTVPNVAVAKQAISKSTSSTLQTVSNAVVDDIAPPTINIGKTQASTINVAVAVLAPTVVVVDATNAYEDYCVLKYVDWPATGTTVYNHASTGATYNGTAYQNDYGTIGYNGATGWVFPNNTSDKITVPDGAAIQNMTAVTFEFIYYYAGVNANNQEALFNKPDATKFLARIYTASGDRLLEVGRWASNVTWDLWRTPAATFTAGNWYFIQLTWALGTTYAGVAPIVYINNISQTMTHTSTASGAWGSDVGAMTVGNSYTGNYSLNGTLALMRVHNVVLTTAQLQQNYYADIWRYASAWSESAITAPNVAASVLSPVVDVSLATITVVPDTAAATAAISHSSSLQIATINTAAAIAAISTSSSFELPAPDVAAAPLDAPTWALATTQSITPTVAAGTPYAVVIDAYSSEEQETVPDVAVETPIIGVSTDMLIDTIDISVDVLGLIGIETGTAPMVTSDVEIGTQEVLVAVNAENADVVLEVVPDTIVGVLEIGIATVQILPASDVGADICALESCDCSTSMFAPDVSAATVAINIWGLATYSSAQTVIPAVDISVLEIGVDVVEWTPPSSIKYQTGLTVEELDGVVSSSVELQGEEPMDEYNFDAE